MISIQAQIRASLASPERVMRAAKRAGRDALRTAKTDAKREIRTRKAIRPARAAKSIRVFSPAGVQTLEGLEWGVRVYGNGFPLIDYGARQTKKGVSVKINVGKRVLIKSAFIATMANGHRGVFVRKGKTRFPIKELYSSTPADVFRDKGTSERVLARAGVVFGSTFSRNLKLT